MISNSSIGSGSFNYVSNNDDVFVTGGQSVLSVNGKTYTGSNIVVRNNRIVVDGVDQTDDVIGTGASSSSHAVFNVEIKVTGNPERVSSTCGPINVTGNVTGGGRLEHLG